MSGDGFDQRRWLMNEREWAALCELVRAGYPYAAILYSYELRVHMDFATGVVGETRRLSQQGLLELLERRPERGSRRPQKQRNRDWLQRQIRALIRHGLIERIPEKQLCFRLVLADTKAIRANEERTYCRTYECTNPEAFSNEKTPANLRVVGGTESRLSAMSALNNGLISGYERTTSVSLKNNNNTGAQPFGFAELAAVDIDMVARAYHAVLPGLPRVRFVDTPAHRCLVARIWYHPGQDGQPTARHQSDGFWRWYFEQCRDSDFLMGRVSSRGRGPFRASFGYLLREEVFLKVLNGGYS